MPRWICPTHGPIPPARKALASHRSSRRRRPSPTPSTTPSACGFARHRSLANGCSERSLLSGRAASVSERPYRAVPARPLRPPGGGRKPMRSFDYASAATVEEAIQIADGQHASREGTPRFDGTPPPSTPSPVRQGARTDGHDGAGNGTSGYVAAALAGHGAPRFLAGGTDLLTLMKADVTMPSLLIDV